MRINVARKIRAPVARTTVGILLLLISGATIGLANENETFGVAPHPTLVDGVERRTFEIPLEVGQTFEDAIRIFNKTGDIVTVAVYAEEAAVDEGGAITVSARSSRPQGLASWISVAQENAQLSPHGEEIVDYRIQIRSAEPDPELAAIVVENTAETPGEGVEGVQRIAILVRSAPPGTPTAAMPVLDARSPLVFLWLLVIPLAASVLYAWRRRRAGETAESDDELAQAPLLSPEAVVATEPAGAPPQPDEEPADQPSQEPGSDTAQPEPPKKVPPRRPRTRPKNKRPSGRNYIPLDEL